MSLAAAQQSTSDPTVNVARRSQNVTTDAAASDGTVWEEKLAVCEGANNSGEPQLLIRSFYQSMSTGERLWDEPPSGAGSVIHASVEDRKKAELQRSDLQLTLEMIPDDARNTESNVTAKPEPKKEKKGLFGRFKRKKDKKQVDTAKDINLQRAIARSISEQTYTGPDPSSLAHGGSTGGVDDDLELAKALSMSVMDTSQPTTEEELFQRALEKSQRDNGESNALGVASLPTTFDESSSSSPANESATFLGGKTPEDSFVNHEDERKPPTSMQFDPYVNK